MFRYLLLFCCIISACSAQVVPHPRAHAHNDYEHTRPLFEALEHGFTIVEADVHLADGKLLVSHDKPTASAKTLEALYLRPLDSIIKKNSGRVYPGYTQPVYLMIDVKTEAESTYQAIASLLKNYQSILKTPQKDGPLTVFISGNRAIQSIVNDHLVGIDGRPTDLGKGYSSDIMPVISTSYQSVMKWNGEGEPSKEELAKLKTLADRVHAEQKKFRLWAMPDNSHAWEVLMNAGIDIINTDKLNELDTFLKSKKL